MAAGSTKERRPLCGSPAHLVCLDDKREWSSYAEHRARVSVVTFALYVTHTPAKQLAAFGLEQFSVERVRVFIPCQRNALVTIENEYVSGGSQPTAPAVHWQLEARFIAPSPKGRFDQAAL